MKSNRGLESRVAAGCALSITIAAALAYPSVGRAEYFDSLDCTPGIPSQPVVGPDGTIIGWSKEVVRSCTLLVVDYISYAGAGYGSGLGSIEGGGRGGTKDPPVDPCDFTASPTIAVAMEKGNPIDISTGMKTEREIDFSGDGLVPLALERRYRSYNMRNGLFGWYWESNFDFGLQVSGANLDVNIPGRGVLSFVPDTVANKWKSAVPGANASVTKAANGTYTLVWTGDTTQTYDATGRVTSVTDMAGLGYTFAYNAGGRLDRVTATGGRYVQFVWTGSQLTRVVDPAGNQYNYTYAANQFGTDQHRLSTVKYPGETATSVTYHYEGPSRPGALTGKTFGTTRYSWFNYDNQGRATSTEHRVGSTAIERFGLVYSTPDASTLNVTETNPLGKQASYRFVGGVLESITGLPSASCPASLHTRTKDANGFPDVVTDFNDRQVNFDHDTNGRLVKEVRGFGSANPTTITYTWNTTTNRMESRTVAGDHSVTMTYNTAGRIATETVKNLAPYGTANQTRLTTYAYVLHPNGMTSSMTQDGPLPGTGDAVTNAYSTTGDLLTVSSALGTLQTFSNYNGLGLPGRMVDAYGVTFDYIYDGRGRLKSETRTVNGVATLRTWTFDLQGNVIAESLPDGRSQASTYDAAGRLTQIVEPEEIEFPDPEYDSETLEKKWFYTYDAGSNVIKERRNRDYAFWYYDEDFHKVMRGGAVTGEVSSLADYDELGRVKARRGNNGQNIRFGYDTSGFVTSVTDSLNRATSFVYDAQNRVITSTDAKNGITRFTYDAGDRIASVTDPRGLVTTYQYDGFGQLWRVQSPDTGITTFAYDAYGRRTGETSPDLTATSYTYDTIGRVLTQQSGAASQAFGYDSCINGLGRLCSVTDASGSSTFSYTKTGMPAAQVNTIAGTAYTTSYSYDALDRLSGVTYPDGKSVTYGFSGAELRSVTATPNGASQTVASSMHYQPFGDLTSLVYGNGLYRTINFDNDARLTSIVTSNPGVGTTQSLTYAWNAADQITGITNGRSAALSQTYGFDELGRLLSASRTGTSEGFGYDAAGNRTSYSKTGQATHTLGYASNSNRLLSSSQPRVWTYDGNGNSNGFTGADGVAVALHSDAFGRVDGSSRNNQATAYLVDALGQRVSKAGPNGTTRFIYAPGGKLLAEYKVGTGWTNYIWVDNQLLGMIRSNALLFAHTDHLGRPELVTNSSKAVVWSANNYAFDRTVASDSIGGLNLGFPGQYFDSETGLWQNFRRDYDASIGRYVQSDPIGLDGGTNTYAYVFSSPIRLVDPEGLSGGYIDCVSENMWDWGKMGRAGGGGQSTAGQVGSGAIVANATGNALVGYTSGGVALAPHATTWEHVAGSRLGRQINRAVYGRSFGPWQTRLSTAGKVLGRLAIAPTLFEGGWDLAVEIGCVCRIGQ